MNIALKIIPDQIPTLIKRRLGSEARVCVLVIRIRNLPPPPFLSATTIKHISFPPRHSTVPPTIAKHKMESTRLHKLISDTYIPPTAPAYRKEVPSYHPCLIVQDSQTDVNKVKECGCADSYCVKNAPKWIPLAPY